MPPRRAIKKEVSVELSSDSSLSSAQSVDEENGLHEQDPPTTISTPIHQEPKSRKRRTQALTNVDSPGKRIKIAKVEISEESRERDSPTTRTRGTRKTERSTRTEVGVDSVQVIETSIQVEESETKRTPTRKKPRTRKLDTEGDKTEKTIKKPSEAGKEGAGSVHILDGNTIEDTPKKVKRRRKTKEEKEAEAMPLAARTVGIQMFIGAHVSAAKGWFHAAKPFKRGVLLYIVQVGLRSIKIIGVHNAVTNAVHIG